MTDEQKNKAREFLKDRVLGVCPSCHRPGPFHILDELVAAPLFRGNAPVLGGSSLPLVALLCGNCFFVRTYSAKMMGLLDSEPDDQPKPDINIANL
jgi:hypothetical protein